jgi:peptide/nickel transport system permease protein
MIRIVVRRLMSVVPVILATLLFIMIAFQVAPGDPVALLLGQGASQEIIARLRSQLHLDRPLLVRYGEYVMDIAKGDLGRSIIDGRPIAKDLKNAWVATLQLGTAAFVISAVLGILLGVSTAYARDSSFDNIIRIASTIGLSMPVFWTGAVLILVMSLWLGLLPSGGRGSFLHLILPAVTLAIPSAATLTRITRASILEVLHEAYVRTARAKGVRERTVLFRHAFRNAYIPVVTVLGIQVGQLLGGAVLTETVFAWPGLGRLIVQAIFSRDYTVVQGGVLVLALSFVLANLAVDILYVILDPRIMYT